MAHTHFRSELGAEHGGEGTQVQHGLTPAARSQESTDKALEQELQELRLTASKTALLPLPGLLVNDVRQVRSALSDLSPPSHISREFSERRGWMLWLTSFGSGCKQAWQKLRGVGVRQRRCASAWSGCALLGRRPALRVLAAPWPSIHTLRSALAPAQRLWPMCQRRYFGSASYFMHASCE